MSTTSNVLQAVLNALACDADMHAWCVETFGRGPSVHLGIDENRPPAEDDYPLVALVGVEQVRGQDRRELEWKIFLGVGVVNDSIAQSGTVLSRTGFLQAETLRELAENALYRARLCDVESSGDASGESYHPLYVSYTTVVVRQLKTTRRAMP